MVPSRRYLSTLIAGLLIVGAAVVTIRHGRHLGHTSAYIAGSVVGVVAVALILVTVARLIWVRVAERTSELWSAGAILAVGIVALVAAAGNAARGGSAPAPLPAIRPTETTPAGGSSSSTGSAAAQAAASCVAGHARPFGVIGRGYGYAPLTEIQSRVQAQLNAENGTSGRTPVFVARNVTFRGQVIALVTTAAGAGDGADQASFSQFVLHMLHADPRSERDVLLTGGGTVEYFQAGAIHASLGFAGCYGMLVEAPTTRAVTEVTRALG